MSDPGYEAAGTAAQLPSGARRLLAELAAAVLGELTEAEVPPSLRRVRDFAPARRAKAAAAQLLAALDRDPLFRQHTAAAWAAAYPWVASEWSERGDPDGSGRPAGAGEPDAAEGTAGPPDADAGAGEPDAAEGTAGPPDAQAQLVGAFLVRPDGWQRLLIDLAQQVCARESQRRVRHAEAASRVQAETAAEELRRVKAELLRVRARAETLAGEMAALRREHRRLRSDVDRSRAAARTAQQEAVQAQAAARAREEEAEATVRRARAQVHEAEVRLEQSRRLVREGRSLTDLRARLLLDTIVDAASGLRRELALPPATVRPADLVAPTGGDGDRPTSADILQVRARPADDPAFLEQLLLLPKSHLVVDGYNVTKTAYGSLPLAEQRRRLVDGLAVTAVRTAVEVTCCFDGADVDATAAMRVRGVRVIFSAPGQTADELIRRLLRVEPQGRPMIVVSSDAEVAADSRASGAHAVPSGALVRLLAGRSS